MLKKIIIVSAKYAPGLLKEVSVIGEKLEQLGCQVIYILAKKYEDIVSEYIDSDTDTSNYHYLFESANSQEIIKDTIRYQFTISQKVDRLFSDLLPDFVLVYNPHPLNFLILKQAKKLSPHCTTAIYLHEPYKPDKHLYGVVGSFYFKIVDISQEIAIEYTDVIILPSRHALDLFKIRFPNFIGKFYLAPILIPDRPVEPQTRKFYTIAGGMNEGKGLDLFCELIEYAAEKKLDYQFRILTSSNIQSYLGNLSQAAKDITLIENPRLITDQEMFQAHAESKAFFLLHTTATQSGAMTVAFMQGTPIIARSIPAFSQFVNHKENSYLVPRECQPEDLISAMEYTDDHNAYLSFNARQSFEDVFSDINWHHNYLWLIDLLSLKSPEIIYER